ncbi:MAG: hypothetical protein A2385_03965 [Bdellovibrionales bacterium RIFOXYB1_FULL_39_21]|nr:MAG: hypothetical protein A2385_03965 [Bdellovibrionales bacterium RIFOXYB1_FULL_39_21]
MEYIINGELPVTEASELIKTLRQLYTFAGITPEKRQVPSEPFPYSIANKGQKRKKKGKKSNIFVMINVVENILAFIQFS